MGSEFKHVVSDSIESAFAVTKRRKDQRTVALSHSPQMVEVVHKGNVEGLTAGEGRLSQGSGSKAVDFRMNV